MVDFAMAASDDFFYFTSEEMDASANKNVKCLYQADLKNGNCEKLAQYDRNTIILGAYDQKLLLEHPKFQNQHRTRLSNKTQYL